MWAKETGYVSLSFILAILLVSSAAFGSENQLDKYPVRFVVIGDRTGEAQEGVYELALEEIERLKPDFVVTVGDMIEGPVFDSTELDRRWNEYLSLVKTLSMPIYFTPGNNDIDTDIMLPAYERFIGDPYFSFDHRGLHFVILDNSRTPTAAGVPDAQLEWLRKDLAAASDAEYTLAFMHKPTWYHTVSTGAQDSLHNVMRDGGVDAVFTGHFHTYFSGIYNGMVFTAVGSSGGGVTPGPTGIEYQYMWVTVDADGIHPVPVELGSVLPHDAVTSDDNRLYWTIRNSAISFEQPVLLDDKMTVNDAEVVVKVRNPNGSVPVTDTIRWELPENWYVTPPVAPFSVEPGQEAELAFNVSNDGQMYPPPSLSAEFLFADGKRSRARTYLACARTTSVPRASESPVIDGQIDETVWSTPVSTLFDPAYSESQIEPVHFYFAHDSRNFYMAAHCRESVMDSLAANMTERNDAVYGEDCVGILYQPNPDDTTVYQFYVNPIGTVYDQRITSPGVGSWDGDPTWLGEYELKTSRGDDYWCIEVRIPLDQFGIQAKSGDSWRVNFRRKQKRLDNNAGWQIPWSYNPNTFGMLLFE